MNSFRQQIEQMSPERFARAAKRAAALAKQLADKAGIPISPGVQHLLDSIETELAYQRRAQMNDCFSGCHNDIHGWWCYL